MLGALHAMAPFVIGRSPWESERIRQELWHRGIWSWRQHTACFAYPGIDMALWDICGKAAREPLYNLFGGKVRELVSYFFYCSQGTKDYVADQARDGLAKGFRVFYLKVGIDIDSEIEMVRTLRETIGPKNKIRLDANGAWKVNEALRNLARLDEFNIDFIEQPVVQDPVANMQEVRNRGTVAVSANEGLWTVQDAFQSDGRADRRRLLLQPILHRIPGAISAALLGRALSGLASMPAYPRRVRNHGGRLPPRSSDSSQRR